MIQIPSLSSKGYDEKMRYSGILPHPKPSAPISSSPFATPPLFGFSDPVEDPKKF